MSVGMGLVTWAPGMSLAALEREVIQNAFKFYRGNKSATAQGLGVSVRTIELKLQKYKEEEQEQKERDDAIRERNQEFLTRSRGINLNPTLASAPIPKLQPHADDGEEADSRLYSQPATAAAAESPVSMPQRAEVQELLPSKTAVGGSNRRR